MRCGCWVHRCCHFRCPPLTDEDICSPTRRDSGAKHSRLCAGPAHEGETIHEGLRWVPPRGRCSVSPQRQPPDAVFSTKHFTDTNGRAYIEGDMYRTLCTCRPAKTDLDSKCFVAKVEIKYEKPFDGALDPDHPVIDAENLRLLIGDPAVRRGADQRPRCPRVRPRPSPTPRGRAGPALGPRERSVLLGRGRSLVGRDFGHHGRRFWGDAAGVGGDGVQLGSAADR